MILFSGNEKVYQAFTFKVKASFWKRSTLLTILIFLLSVPESNGQRRERSYHTLTVDITKTKRPKRIIVRIQSPPQLSLTDTASIRLMEEDFSRAIRYRNGAKPGSYRVSVRLLEERDGSIVDYYCLEDPGYGMCPAIVQEMKKKFRLKWKGTEPAQQ